MARTRLQNFLDGVSITPPTGVAQIANQLENFANDAAFETANGAGQPGDIYFNTTSNIIRVYKNGAWQNILAAEVSFDNTTSALTATDVQDAIDELDGRLDTAETTLAENVADVADIRTTTGTADEDVDMGTFTGTTISDNVSIKDALQEIETAYEATDTLLDGHLDGGVNKHDASEIDYEQIGGNKVDISSGTGDVEVAIRELDFFKASTLGRNKFTAIDFEEAPQTVASTTTLTAPYMRLTGGGSTIDGLDPGVASKYFILNNMTGAAITIANESVSAAAAQRIITGQNADILLADEASIAVIYNNSDSRWMVVGGTGSGSGGGGGGGTTNLILNPNADSVLDAGGIDDIGDWIDSSTGTVSSRTTTAAEIALEDIKENGIKITLASGTTHYTRVRFQVPAGYQNQNLSLSWVQRVSGLSAEDMKVELYNYSDNYASDEAEVALFSDDTSGDTFISISDGAVRTAFSANAREYYELRFINNGGTSGYLSLNDVVINNSGGANGAVVTGAQTSTVPWTSGNAGVVAEDLFVWRRSGEYMEIDLHFQQTSATGASGGSGVLRFTLPDGLTVDDNKLPIKDSSPSAEQDEMISVPFGTYIVNTTGTAASVLAFAFAESSTSIGFCSLQGSTNDYADISAGVLGNANPTLNGTMRIPISEWAGSGTINQMDRGITQSNARVRFYRGTGYSYVANNQFAWDAEDTTTFDPQGVFTNSSGSIGVPVDGLYNINVTIQSLDLLTAGAQLTLQADRQGAGGVQERIIDRPAGSGYKTEGNAQIYLRVGDTFRVILASNATVVATHDATFLEVTRVADHSAVAPVGFGEATATQYGLVKAPNGYLEVTNGAEANGGLATGNTAIRVFDSLDVDEGDCWLYENDPVNGARITMLRDAVISIFYTDRSSSAGWAIAISKNPSVAQMDLDATDIPANIRYGFEQGTAGQSHQISITMKVAKNDVLRPHCNASATYADVGRARFNVTELVNLG